jgi:hypothetical protein
MTKGMAVFCMTLLVLLAGCGSPATLIPASPSGTPDTSASGTPAAANTQSAQAQPSATSLATPTDTPTSPAAPPTATSTQPPPTATNTAPSTPTQTNTPVPPTHTPTATPTKTPTPQTIQHAISVTKARDIYHIRLTAAGQIKVHATWTGSQSGLALIINGPGQVQAFARQDGASPLEVSYTVTPANFAAGHDWTVSVASFGSGQASGTVSITYPSGSSQSPVQDSFSVSNNGGRVVYVLVLKRAGPIQAQATWTGTPAGMALIVNGPGQVGYFARQDSGSPLSVDYTVTAANFASGDIWRVSLASFTTPNADGNLKVTFP